MAVLKPQERDNKNGLFRKDASQIFKSHFGGNVLLKLTSVYFVVAENVAYSPNF